MCTAYSRDNWLQIKRLEKALIEAAHRYSDAQARLGIKPPFFVAIGLAGVKELMLDRSLNPAFDDGAVQRPIDRDVLLTPEVMVEDAQPKFDELLKQSFDVIWQSVGFQGSQSYTAGRWIEPGYR